MLTVPLTAWTAGKFVTSTCVSFTAGARVIVRSELMIFRSTGVAVKKATAVTQTSTNP